MSVQVQEISREALVKIEGNYRAIGRLMIIFNCHQKTIERMLESNDIRLTTPGALSIILEESGMPLKKVLIDSKN